MINTVRGSIFNNSIFKESSVERDRDIDNNLMTIQVNNGKFSSGK